MLTQLLWGLGPTAVVAVAAAAPYRCIYTYSQLKQIHTHTDTHTQAHTYVDFYMHRDRPWLVAFCYSERLHKHLWSSWLTSKPDIAPIIHTQPAFTSFNPHLHTHTHTVWLALLVFSSSNQTFAIIFKCQLHHFLYFFVCFFLWKRQIRIHMLKIKQMQTHTHTRRCKVNGMENNVPQKKKIKGSKSRVGKCHRALQCRTIKVVAIRRGRKNVKNSREHFWA